MGVGVVEIAEYRSLGGAAKLVQLGWLARLFFVDVVVLLISDNIRGLRHNTCLQI
jgi:hypothetical protein